MNPASRKAFVLAVDLALVERLIELVGRAPISELDLSQDGWRLRLVKTAAPSARLPEGRHETEMDPARAGAPDGSPPSGVHVIAAGLVGTFYRRPGPDKPPFVAVGDEVRDGQTLGLLEAMKTLIPIEADRAGRVGAILAEDGATVEAGTPLFTIDPADHP